MKGAHYNIGGGALSFAPLARIDGGSEQAWAEEWIAGLLELQNVPLTPPMRNAVHKGMELLRAQPENMRSLTHFSYLVPDEAIREALQPYTSKGVLGTLLDAETDELGLSSLVVFEVESLLRMGDNNAIPVLNYLFHRIEGALDGAPSLLVLDEAWIMLGHPVFRAKIREWLKVLRKANCAVVMATQSLSDAQGSGIMDVLVESCPTKIYLPNAAALSNAEQIGFYKGCGLNERQIAMIGHAVPKRDYYMVNDDGRRLFQLGLSAKELAFVGASDKGSIARIRELMAEHGQPRTRAASPVSGNSWPNTGRMSGRMPGLRNATRFRRKSWIRRTTLLNRKWKPVSPTPPKLNALRMELWPSRNRMRTAALIPCFSP